MVNPRKLPWAPSGPDVLLIDVAAASPGPSHINESKSCASVAENDALVSIDLDSVLQMCTERFDQHIAFENLPLSSQILPARESE